MAADTMTAGTKPLHVPGAPNLPGLSFRHFRGPEDYPHMVAVLQRSKEADKIEEVSTVEDIAESYADLKNCDPYKDVVVAEIGGDVIGYKRVTWWEELDGTLIYGHFGFLVPEWRDKGIGRALLRHSEARLREIAAQERHATDVARYFDTGAYKDLAGLVSLLQEEGYEPVRYFYDMIRPTLEEIPDFTLPEGIEVRPVTTDHYRAIWEAEVEAFKDHWGEGQVEERDFDRWKTGDPRSFQPHLWKVAWEGDQVVGMVRNFIVDEENRKHNRKRGYTEYISVRRPWRKRGVAKALIAGSLRMHKELGMEEAALGVDAENPSGALQLYQSMGFEVVRQGASYRKAWK